ncbi:MAG: hypothetical protein M3O70_05915 [Actinomycetota bacterium]|nr:hypothetical protein [Actinomycetota bacterium]
MNDDNLGTRTPPKSHVVVVLAASKGNIRLVRVALSKPDVDLPQLLAGQYPPGFEICEAEFNNPNERLRVAEIGGELGWSQEAGHQLPLHPMMSEPYG